MTPSTAPELSAEQAEILLRSDRFKRLASELRCLVCQNQTLADSNAELAGDLRAEVLRQMATGKDDAAIKAHLVARFGEFVLYRPTLNAHNIGLWAGPAVLASLAGLALWRITRRRQIAAARTPTASVTGTQSQFEQIDALLGPSGSRQPTPPSSSTKPSSRDSQSSGTTPRPPRPRG